MAAQKKGEGWVQTLKRRPLGPPLGPRLGLGVGVQGLRCRGVGGRGTGPQGRSKFRNLRRILTFLTRTKKKKNGALVPGW